MLVIVGKGRMRKVCVQRLSSRRSVMDPERSDGRSEWAKVGEMKEEEGLNMMFGRRR